MLKVKSANRFHNLLLGLETMSLNVTYVISTTDVLLIKTMKTREAGASSSPLYKINLMWLGQVVFLSFNHVTLSHIPSSLSDVPSDLSLEMNTVGRLLCSATCRWSNTDVLGCCLPPKPPSSTIIHHRYTVSLRETPFLSTHKYDTEFYCFIAVTKKNMWNQYQVLCLSEQNVLIKLQ